MRNFYLVVVALTAWVAAPLRADDTSRPAVDFQRDIRPILSNSCFKCHGPGTQEGGVRLDLRERALRRKIIVPGKPEASKFIARVTADDDERMPPADADKRLTAAQVAKLKAWIEQGAEYPPHWAYVPPRASPLPAVKDRSWPRNGIDYFILARLEQAGLRPSPPADKVTLIRRAYLDLLGLLPEPRDVEAFLQDERPDAYERLIDRLLDSPHYGERQARHWLDLARYADSNGYTIDGKRSIWPYRDWVINAFNRDMPFDQFTIEQLAGDLLAIPPAPPSNGGQQKTSTPANGGQQKTSPLLEGGQQKTSPPSKGGAPTTSPPLEGGVGGVDSLIATGFHRNTPYNEEGGTDKEQFRVERTVDRTNTTGTVWLGLTVGCAQCHDHKFDAISQQEYYQFYAFFNSVEEPQLALPTAEQRRRLGELNAALARHRPAGPPPGERTLEEIAASLRKEAHGGWMILDPASLKSENGTKLSRSADLSVLAGGPTPDTDVYTVRATAPGGPITAVRLEALTHPSLPQKGPGRASNGNFVLSHFVLEVAGQPIRFRRALADHSQKKYDVADALLGDPKKGWAINGDQGKLNVNRHAVFLTEQPISVARGEALTFRLKFSEWPKRYPLGRFRLAVAAAPERFVELPLAAQKILLTDPQQRSDEEVESLREVLARVADKATPKADEQRRLEKEIKELQAAVATSLILRASDPPRPTHVHERGDFLSKGDPVQPGTFASLPPLDVRGRPANRLDLARWLVHPDNPLPARVVVNRMWQQYFGKGLVETENDFGMQGTPPTHPELLDWLAVEFVGRPTHGGSGDRAWGMKRLHRLILTSAAYRQSSVVRPDLLEQDPNNRLLGRQARLRLEAEIIRDAALSASGLLNRQIGGPGVFPPQPPEVFSFTQSRQAWPESQGPDRYRRGLYTFLWRQSQHPLLTTFDGADAQTACTRRNRSDTPLQALHLANDRAFVELAEGLARRILREGPADDAGRIDFAFRLCLARAPAAPERERLRRYLDGQPKPRSEAAWTALARVLFNLDEFITRE